MSKTAAELLRELDAKATKGPWACLEGGGHKSPSIVGAESAQIGGWLVPRGGISNASYSREVCEFRAQMELPTPAANRHLIVTLRNALPLLAAVLDAADAMEEQHPHAQRPFDHDTFGIAAYRVARAALAEALKEGR